MHVEELSLLANHSEGFLSMIQLTTPEEETGKLRTFTGIKIVTSNLFELCVIFGTYVGMCIVLENKTCWEEKEKFLM